MTADTSNSLFADLDRARAASLVAEALAGEPLLARLLDVAQAVVDHVGAVIARRGQRREIVEVATRLMAEGTISLDGEGGSSVK